MGIFNWFRRRPTPPPTPPPEPTENQKEIQRRYLVLLNEYRKELNLPLLILDEKLNEGAYTFSIQMYNDGRVSHKNFENRMNALYPNTYAAENVAKNNTIEEAFSQWKNSMGHRLNMISRSYTHCGIGSFNGYFTANFVRKTPR